MKVTQPYNELIKFKEDRERKKTITEGFPPPLRDTGAEAGLSERNGIKFIFWEEQEISLLQIMLLQTD